MWPVGVLLSYGIHGLNDLCSRRRECAAGMTDSDSGSIYLVAVGISLVDECVINNGMVATYQSAEYCEIDRPLCSKRSVSWNLHRFNFRVTVEPGVPNLRTESGVHHLRPQLTFLCREECSIQR
jgi:hypothetical protein